jgi:Mrp family chromosome partitioning ATPase
MQHLLEDLAQHGLVIVDAPPLLPVTDAAVLTRSADGCLLVISAGGTLDSELLLALNNITSVHGRPLGVILNRVSARGSGAYSYYGEYATARATSADLPTPVGLVARLRERVQPYL